jgi:hypothetical protein
MATLNETAHISRLGIKYGLAVLVAMIVGRFALGIATDVYQILFPEPPPPPTIGFGILPDIEFPKQSLSSLTYTLETPSGGFPVFPDKLGVYPVIVERPNLLALERSVNEAKSLGFSEPPNQLNETTFRWTGNLGIPGTLTMNIYDGRFVVQYDWTAAPDFLLTKQNINEALEADKVLDTLNSAKLIGSDLRLGTFTTSYLIASGQTLTKTVSLSEADFIELNFYRTPLETVYEVVTPDPDKGVVQARLSRHPSRARVVYLEFNYFPVDYDQIETYPLKPVTQAYQELLSGEGYVAKLDNLVTSVVVRRVELGYYDSYTKQPYLQPVYIFRGDNGFVGYVQAVRDPTLTPTVTQAR